MGIHPGKKKKKKNSNLKGYFNPVFTAAVFIRVKSQSKCLSADEWVKKIGTYIRWNIIRPYLNKKEIVQYATT